MSRHRSVYKIQQGIINSTTRLLHPRPLIGQATDQGCLQYRQGNSRVARYRFEQTCLGYPTMTMGRLLDTLE